MRYFIRKIPTICLLILILATSACVKKVSFNNKIAAKEEFVFGRIKIYQVYSDRKMRDISFRCQIPNNSAISDSALSITYLLNKNRFDYFFEHGLIVFKQKPNQALLISQINCTTNYFADSIVIKNFTIKTPTSRGADGIKYLGDVDIFISLEPDDKYVLRCIGNACAASSFTTFYHYPKRILISNNQDETYAYMATKIKELNQNNLAISYQPMKLLEKNETKDITKSTKKMPF